MRFAVAFLCLCLVAFSAGIKIDGVLDEAEWIAERQIAGFKNLKGREQLKNQPTWFKIIKADGGVYVGVHCVEPKVAEIPVQPSAHENHGEVFGRNHVELFFSPGKDRDVFYQFAIGIDNERWCQYWVEGGTAAFETYHCLWQSATHRGDGFWSAEVYIPYSAFYHTPSTEFKTAWYMNVARQRKGFNPVETTCWANLIASFTEPEHFNTVSGFKPKTAAQDFSVGNVVFTAEGQDGDFLEGKLKLNVSTGVARAAGKLEIGEPFNCTRDFAALKKGENTLLFEGLKISASANNKKFSTLLRFGEYGGRYYLINIKFRPCRIALDEPCYRNSFYPDETPKTISGVLYANVPSGTKASISISGAKLEQTVSGKVMDGKMPFTFDARKMEIGKATIMANVGAFTASEEVSRLPMPANGHYSRISRNGIYLRNGKPAFFLGWRGGDGYLVSAKNLKRWPEAKDRCSVVNSLGAEVWVDHLVKPEMPRSTRDVEPTPEYLEKLREKILENKDKKIMGWLLGEEPECRNISPVYLKYVYDFIKELDPYNPVICCTRSPRAYIDTADLFRVHPYLTPVVDAEGRRSMKSPTFVGKVCRETLEAGNGRKGLWVTLGFFAYNFINMWATPPNYDECNCMTWTSVVNGTTGFFTYIYYQTFESHELLLASDFIYVSLDRLSPYIMTPEDNGDVKVESQGKVEACIKRLNGKYVLVAVNEAPEETSAVLTSSLFNGKLHEFRGDRSFTPEKGVLKLTFKPYEAFVLTSAVEDEGLEKLSALRAKVKAHDDAVANAGNILFEKGRELEFSIIDKGAKSGNTCMLKALLTNGVDNELVWRAKSPNAAIEVLFTTFEPEFNKVVVHGALLDGLELYSWERGKYVKLQPDEMKKDEFRTEFIFNKKQDVVKLKLQFKKYQAELYEQEMY